MATAIASSSGATTASAFSSLPVLHLPPADASREDELAFCDALREVCRTVGFFYVADHGVSAETMSGALSASRRFFALPDSAKLAMDNRGSPAFRGYVRLGAENTAGAPDWREQVEFGVEAAAPSVDERRRQPPHARLVGPNRWPDETLCPGFRDDLLRFMDETSRLSRRLMELLALSLHLDRAHFEPTFGDDPNVQMKIARYPPEPERDGPSPETSASARHPSSSSSEGSTRATVGRFGVGAHTDSGYLSVLLQDDVGGLQVRNGLGEWIDAPPVPGALVVNLGEMVQLCTNRYYLATPHRVVSKPTPPGRAPRDRISVPFFWNPRLDAVVAPIDPMPATLPGAARGEGAGGEEEGGRDGRDEKDAAKRNVSVAMTDSHGEGRNALLGCYGANALKSLARSHPEVMRRHHPDLKVLPDGRVVRREED